MKKVNIKIPYGVFLFISVKNLLILGLVVFFFIQLFKEVTCVNVQFC